MKIIILIIGILFLFANQAWAENWILYASTNLGDTYYYKSSIKRVNKNIVKVCIKTILNENSNT